MTQQLTLGQRDHQQRVDVARERGAVSAQEKAKSFDQLKNLVELARQGERTAFLAESPSGRDYAVLMLQTYWPNGITEVKHCRVYYGAGFVEVGYAGADLSGVREDLVVVAHATGVRPWR